MSLYRSVTEQRTLRTVPTDKISSGDKAKSDASKLLRLHALVENCQDIPKLARETEIAYVDDRLFDTAQFLKITDSRDQDNSDDSLSTSIQRRIKSLTPFVGRRLVCMVIKLPGVRYTIEIDPSEERIVHWEWQPL